MNNRQLTKLYRITGFDLKGRTLYDDYVSGVDSFEALTKLVMTEHIRVDILVDEWRVRECPTPMMFNAHHISTGWRTGGDSRRIRKMLRLRNYMAVTYYQVDHDLREAQLARALMSYYRQPLNLT